MPAFTGLLQVATTHLLLKYGVKAGVLYQEKKVLILMPVVSCSSFTSAWHARRLIYEASTLLSLLLAGQCELQSL